jgi:hypothetical protein
MKVTKLLARFLPLALVVTAMSLLVYVAVQQDLRQGANDPQIQMAEDGAQLLDQGRSIGSALPTVSVDIAKSLALFVIVYDPSGRVLASSGQLDGQTPVLPQGVHDYVDQHGQDRLTWQPRPNVRLASVVVKTNDGRQVLAARNLREIEKREDQLGNQVALTWLVTMALILAGLVTWSLIKK